jgi:cytochrome c biogenesis protein CcdA
MKPLAVWQRLWLLFSVIWVVVGLLNVFTLAMFGEPGAGQFVQPVVLTLTVPMLVYLLAWAWASLRARREGERR